MREKERIDRILKLIYRIWKDNPDLRLGQLLANSDRVIENNLFYYEDEDLEDNLNNFIKRYGIK